MDAVVADAGVFSETDPARLRVAWRVPLGSGYSGVTVSAATVVTLFSDGSSDVAAAYDAENGNERWRFTIGPTYKGHDGSFDGPISTPLLAGGLAIGLSPLGRLFALDLESGELVWDVDLREQYGARKPFYGFATSPVLQSDTVVVMIGARDASVAGFDLENGILKWKAGHDRVSFQSPVPIEVGGRLQLVAAGNTQLLGLDPASGRVLWEYAHGGNGPRGAWSMVPVPVGGGRLFLTYKDDSSALVSLDPQGESVVGEQAWASRSIRNTYAVPVYHEGHIYGFSSRLLTCVDAATGESVWRSRSPGDGFLILVDEHLVILTRTGGLHVAKASPLGYKELTRLKLFGDLGWTSPAFDSGSFYLRSLAELARIDVGPGTVLAEAHETVPEPGPTRFGDFLREVHSISNKKRSIDRFLASQSQFPLIESPDLVHFVYRGPGRDMAIAGDMVGARHEESMTQVEGTNFFYYSTRLEPDSRVNYIFIRDFEGITDPRNPRRTSSGILGQDMEFIEDGSEMSMSWLAMPGWSEPDHLRDPEDGVLRGRIESRELQSAVLKTRHSVHVYLPAGYDEGTRRYPVAYFHGGRGARERGRIPVSLDNLLQKSVEPLIAVFIDLVSGGNYPGYAGMWAGELIPFIDANYRTIPAADYRANVGGGSSAFDALVCTFSVPRVAGKVAAQSILMLDFMRRQLESQIRSAQQQPLVVYLDWGKYDLTFPHEAWDIVETNRAFADSLRRRGFAVAGGEVNDGTGWSSWKNRTHILLQTLFPKSADRE